MYVCHCLLVWYITSLCMSLKNAKNHVLHLFGRLTDPGVCASLQAEDLACEKEEGYGPTVEGTSTLGNFTTQSEVGQALLGSTVCT